MSANVVNVIRLRTEYKIEKHVKEDVKKLLDFHHWFWWMPPANGFGKVGTSDINALRTGVFLAVETKFGGNKPTANQKQFLQSVNAENGFGVVVDEKTLPLFAEWLVLFDQAIEHASHGRPVPTENGARQLDILKVLTEPMLFK